jgi:hypothetical protein
MFICHRSSGRRGWHHASAALLGMINETGPSKIEAGRMELNVWGFDRALVDGLAATFHPLCA